MPLDPLNYPNKNDYTAEITKLPSYVQNTDAHYRDTYIREARTHYDSAWATRRSELMKSPYTSEQVTAAQTKGAPWAGGAEMPREFQPGVGGLPDQAPWDTWFAQNIGKPLHRGIETGLAYMAYSGPGANPNARQLAADVWKNPGQYPAFRKFSGGELIESPEGLATLTAAIAMPEILGAYGWPGFAAATPEAGYVGQLGLPALRFASRVGTMAGIGVGINAPKAGYENDPTSSIMGGLQMGAGQALSEVPQGIKRGAVNLFGRTAMRTSYGRSLATAITKYFPNFAGELKTEADFSRIFTPNQTDANGSSVSLLQKSAREDFATIDKEVENKVGKNTFKFQWKPQERQEMYGEIDPKTAQPKGGAPGQYEASRPARPGRPEVPGYTKPRPPLRMPKGQPGAGRVIKMGGTTTVPPVPAVPPTPATPEMQVMTFPEVRQLVYDAEKVGHDMSSGAAGKNIYNKTGVPTMMRGISRRAARVVANDIDAMPGLQGYGKAWLDAKNRDMLANTLTKMFNEQGVIRGSKLGVPELQNAATNLSDEGYYHDFVELMGDKEGHAFLTDIMNGADPRSSPSVRGRINPYVRGHGITGLSTGWHLPTLPYFAGPAAPATWRGMFPVLQRMGPNVVARMLLEASGMDKPVDDTPVLQPSP